MALTLKEHNELSETLGLLPEYRGAVVSVHGMKSRGTWQKQIGPCLQDAGFRHLPVDYGMVLWGAVRRKTVRGIAESLLEAYEEQIRYHPHPSAIGHSLGTLSIGTCLKRYPDVTLKRIILFGSILRQDFPWRDYASGGRVDQVLNETATNDIWPRLARYTIPDSGPSGCSGFLNCDGIVVHRPYEATGHSGLQYSLHYRRVWIPFLRGEDLPA